MTTWLTEPEQEAWRGLLLMTDLLRDTLNRELQQAHGISLADYEILGRVGAAAPGARVKDLMATLVWEQSRISHQLNRLVRAGLVTKLQCDEDRRGSWFQLTPAGSKLMAAAAPDHVASVRRLLFDHVDAAAVRTLGEVSAVVTEQVLRP